MRRWGLPYSRNGSPALVLRALPRGSPITLVDVGASDGAFATSLYKDFGFRKALLVEPQPRRAQQLRDLFASRNVVVWEGALSEQAQQRQMDILKWDYSTSLLPVDHSRTGILNQIDLSVRETISVTVETLDCVCKSAGLDEQIDLLKLDVQGAELLVLKGATTTIQRVRFVLAEVSFRPYYVGGATFDQVLSFMRQHGFRLLGLSEGFREIDRELIEADALFGRDVS